MISFNKSSLIRLIVLIFIFIIGSGLICADEKTPFTAGDSLRVKSFSSQSMTENGRFIAGTISMRLDRLGADHKRYRDPTYISPRPTEVIILDTKTAKTQTIFKTKVQVRSMTFSPDGKTLAFFLRKRDLFYLHIYDMEKKKIRELKLKTKRKIASNSFLIWSPDGRYLYMTYSATDKWERGFTRYDLKERRMRDLVKDSNLYRSLRMSKDGQKFFYNFSNGDLPGDMYASDKDFNGARRLTDLNPWILERKLTRSELVKYLDVDGNELYGGSVRNVSG